MYGLLICFYSVVASNSTSEAIDVLLIFVSFRSMSDDEQESGCDTVDSSPASHGSGHSSGPFTERHYIADSNQNCEPRVACVAPETEPSKPTVRTVVVPPMRVQNNNNCAVSEIPGNTGKP